MPTSVALWPVPLALTWEGGLGGWWSLQMLALRMLALRTLDGVSALEGYRPWSYGFSPWVGFFRQWVSTDGWDLALFEGVCVGTAELPGLTKLQASFVVSGASSSPCLSSVRNLVAVT